MAQSISIWSPAPTVVPGIGFRRATPEEYEYFYLSDLVPKVRRLATPVNMLRSSKTFSSGTCCRCVPQGPAGLRLNEWNHIRIVVAGAKAQIFVNDLSNTCPQYRAPGGQHHLRRAGASGPRHLRKLACVSGVSRILPVKETAAQEKSLAITRWELSPFRKLHSEQDITAQRPSRRRILVAATKNPNAPDS